MDKGAAQCALKMFPKIIVRAFLVFAMSFVMVMLVFDWLGIKMNIDRIHSQPRPEILSFIPSAQTIFSGGSYFPGEIMCISHQDMGYDCKFENGEYHKGVPVHNQGDFWTATLPLRIVCPSLQGIRSTVVLWEECRIIVLQEGYLIPYAFHRVVEFLFYHTAVILLAISLALGLVLVSKISENLFYIPPPMFVDK
jgi:hypothetical protein